MGKNVPDGTSWPVTIGRNLRGEMTIASLSIPDLAREFGTPLYVFDEATLRQRAAGIREFFRTAYPDSAVVYAGKAYISPTLTAILHEEGIGLDVVSGGEIYAGLVSGVDPARMIFHGNNKSLSELEEAVAAGVGLIAVDNAHEIELLSRMRTGQASPIRVVLRLNPGVDPHTHDKMRTGAVDSKFGFPIADGQADQAVDAIAAIGHLSLVGYHAHVGSQIFDANLVAQTIDAILDFAANVRDRTGLAPNVIIPGGGFGVSDDASGDDVSVAAWADVAANTLRIGAQRHGFALPQLIVEPGRAIIGPAGIAVYTVGARKTITGGRTYVSVDGGMSDNIRPSLYGARYTAELANRNEKQDVREVVTIAGKYCESGDVLIDTISMPRLRAGDLIAVPMAGAYCLSMASNYNLAPRPAVVLVREGESRLIRRRETYQEMLQQEIVAGHL